MIYNKLIPLEYGSFSDVSSGTSPVPFKPTPTPQDYINGSISRVFAKKVNESMVIEVQGSQAGTLNAALYTIVTATWIISGPKNNTYTGKIVNQTGVIQQNMFEIDRVNTETGVDLSKVLSKRPLQF